MRFGLSAAALVAAMSIVGCNKNPGDGPAPTPTYTVSGTVTGLSGSGLVIQLNGAGNLTVTGGAFSFAATLTSGSNYSVTVLTQPTNPSQTCTVTNGTGTIGSANVTNVAITCTTNSFTIGGTVTGLSGTGLVLQNNGNNLAVTTANFTFPPILSGATYAVTVLTQPTGPAQFCQVANGSGTVGASNVTNVSVTCVNTFSVGSVTDPLATQQWHLKNTGQNAYADGVGVVGIDINVDLVYSGFGIAGTGVKVAVVDTGMEIAHEDLAANVIPNGSWNFNNSTTDPTNTIDSDGDHGTSVSGLIAMAMNNAKGGIGVAPKAQLKGFNFLSMTLPTEQAFLNSLGASSADPNSSDVFIFNQSFGIDTNTPELVDPQEEAQYLSGVTSLRGGKGALYVKAAGNGFNSIGTVTCPGTLSCENANFDPSNTLPYQIVVGAVNADGIKSSYSTAGSAIWVSAPGGEFGMNNSVSGQTGVFVEPAMVTTDQSGCVKGYSRAGANTSSFNKGVAPNGDVFNPLCNYTNGMNGTSSATPVTVGVIALLLEANPALTWRDVKHILASTARQIDASRAAVNLTLSNGTYVAEPAWTTNAANFKFHDWYGFGMVNASAAVNMARTYTSQLGTFKNTGFVPSPTLSIPIPDNSVTGASNTLSVPAGTVSVIEAVQIRVNVMHTFDGDLGIELVSPSGTRSVLKNPFDGYAAADNLANQVFLSNAFYGENPVGSWTIKIVDGIGGDTGTLTGWAIRVYGN
jgi:subtilisin-like proprotein convertase family protein